jgi:dihydroorotate dehydrogenase
MASSTARLEWAHQVHRGELTMIASGGVMCGADVVEKLIRGARAVQIYSAFIYRGPWVVLKLLRELKEELKLRGFECVEDAINSYYA